MTQNSTILGPKIALYEPDIPQNTAAIIRTCACLGAKLQIIDRNDKCTSCLSEKKFRAIKFRTNPLINNITAIKRPMRTTYRYSLLSGSFLA